MIEFGKSRTGTCCKGCEERHLACHDTCEKYQTALAEWKAYKDMIYQAKKLNEYDQYKMKSIKDMQRRRKKYDRKG